ncbi:hypothetical protein [Halosolutus gelatinilyticus]|uniref:hypothetical protein n=1 Tax=Halosolutus gelatinilyticus TaxID=2931975 RepID=UPI001FF38454|nr:hypothetical protein [Halosolutus gelatinilyticus]
MTFSNFLKELGMRIAAGAIVLGIFFGLGYAKRTDLLGLSNALGPQFGFFAVAFLLIGIVAVGWILFQRYNQ